MKIAILTPTYNRVKLIGRLYESLLKQTVKDYVWIVVDDGSTDGTDTLISDYIASDRIKIRYYQKENGGKARALNYGFQNNPDIDFFAIVDSDDWLMDNAVETIKRKGEEFFSNQLVGGIFFKYKDSSGNPMYDASVNILREEKVMTRYEHDFQYYKEDGCIGYFSRAVKRYKYPEFEKENYIGPIVIQMLMADEFSIAFTNDTIGYAEYQEGGLSKSGRGLRLKNPLGMIYYCSLQQSKKNKNIRSRIKYAIEAQAYCSVLKDKKRIENSAIDMGCIKPWAKLPGMILGMIWKNRL